jgi:hypothetical protein
MAPPYGGTRTDGVQILGVELKSVGRVLERSLDPLIDDADGWIGMADFVQN